MYDLVLLGGGPAGLAAAAYAKGKGLSFRLIADELGGKLGWLERWGGPPAWPTSGTAVAQILAGQAALSPEAVILDQVTELRASHSAVALDTLHHGTLAARALVIATGAAPIELAVAGSRRYLGSGLCYSVATYGHLAVGRRVAVLGGSPRAIADALVLVRTAAHVDLIMPGAAPVGNVLFESLQLQPKLEVHDRSEVTAISGNGAVEALTVVRDGAAAPLPVDVIYVALGLVPNSRLAAGVVAMDESGFIQVNARYETSAPGVFAAGDVSSLFSGQIMTALGDGTRAALSAHEYLQGHWAAYPDELQPV
jgi:thioredoxin reductase